MANSKGTLLLGIDTGGTYTDAVVVDGTVLDTPDAAVLGKSKSLTTPGDLSVGIGDAMAGAIAASAIDPARIGLVSLSTTLATNALVEGQGRPAALVMIGFSEADAARQGLSDGLGRDPLVCVAGGHDALGSPLAPLDEASLLRALDTLPASVEAIAVCGQFAVRNPEHERRARQLIRERRAIPVTCSHELTAEIGGPRRALTALLNARLTALIDDLIEASLALTEASAIQAPLMVVRGDGALVAAAYARERPIETILSGPAASLVGAGWLTGSPDAVVSDIGGTTTDIAVLRSGRPRLDPQGARVGGHQTLVEAVAMRTHGLGGDSIVDVVDGSMPSLLSLGPRRAVPLSVLAQQAPKAVHQALDEALAATRVEAAAGRFYVGAGAASGADEIEEELLQQLSDGPLPAAAVEGNRKRAAAARRLATQARIRMAAFTPTDAAHVLGLAESADTTAARKGAALFARRRGADGRPMAASPEALAEAVLARLVRRSAEHVLEAALAEDGLSLDGVANASLAAAALEGRQGIVAPALPLTVPLIGLGAGARVYYPRVGKMLRVETAVPEHADVANALGAVVGGVQISRRSSVSVPSEGRFRAHLPAGPVDYPDADAAEAALAAALEAEVRAAAVTAGADAPEIARQTDRREATIEGRTVLVEAVITVTATGRPRLARPVEEVTP
ncbi:MAG: hydantoinase/oxoprolinase family protein [Pseudomonadota bacterium]